MKTDSKIINKTYKNIQKQMSDSVTWSLPMSNQCTHQAQFFPALLQLLEVPISNIQSKIKKMVFTGVRRKQKSLLPMRTWLWVELNI